VNELRLKYELATLLRISGLKKQTFYYINKKGDFGAVPDLEDFYTDEYEYDIYY
jgi:uncharacterized protein YcgL (UPF0745 family)